MRSRTRPPRSPTTRRPDDPATSAFTRAPSFVSGGGGLTGTVADYSRFCEMLRQRGELDGERIIGPRTLDLMTMNHLPGGQDLASLDVALRRVEVGEDDRPNSTRTTRPLSVSTRLAGSRHRARHGVLRMEVGERGRGVREPAEHERRTEARSPSRLEQPPEIRAVDPVPHDDVLIAVEGVVTDERYVCMGRVGEQHPGFGEQRLAFLGPANCADLEGDDEIVLTIERLDHAALTSFADHLEQFVAAPEEISHRSAVRPNECSFVLVWSHGSIVA